MYNYIYKKKYKYLNRHAYAKNPHQPSTKIWVMG